MQSNQVTLSSTMSKHDLFSNSYNYKPSDGKTNPFEELKKAVDKGNISTTVTHPYPKHSAQQPQGERNPKGAAVTIFLLPKLQLGLHSRPRGRGESQRQGQKVRLSTLALVSGKVTLMILTWGGWLAPILSTASDSCTRPTAG